MPSPAETLRFSVIVASWNRPSWLKRCLRALSQLDHPAFEIVVVADDPSLAQIDGNGLKCIPFTEQNLARARNAGIAASAGDICAFIDDDAVPEPMWLAYLEDAFHRTNAGAVAGYVRGRNGISFQSQVSSVDAEAETHIEPTATEPMVPKLKPGRALKLVGTNMAVRRDVLTALGGFDEVFRYFLEDTDLSLRVAEAGYAMAVAPLAEVHHAFAASPRRTKLRAPVDLYDIGRSTALFLRRHDRNDFDEMFKRIQRRERARLLRHMVNGTCEPSDIQRILIGLKTGWDDGIKVPLGAISEPKISESDFLSFRSASGEHKVVRSRMLHRRRASLRKATKLAEQGKRVSLFSFSLTIFRHHLQYTPEGVWLQTGGQFGRSTRNRSIFRWCRFAQRLDQEIHRIAKVRGIGEKEGVQGLVDRAATGGIVRVESEGTHEA